MSDFVFTKIHKIKNNNAGTKAPDDAVEILKACGFEPFVVVNGNHKRIVRLIEQVMAPMRFGAQAQNEDLIILQYPQYGRFGNWISNRVNEISSKKNCKVIILVHDIRYLRGLYGRKSQEDFKRREIGLFNAADAVIVHNNIMRERLASDGVKTPMISLGIFDYLYNGKSAEITQDGKVRIIFAGNLVPEKAGFIYQYKPNEKVGLNIYGSNLAEKKTAFDYKGTFSPDELIENLAGNYGLVWDGISTDTCTGAYGNYLRYNNPHKISLYLAAGLPVVVWSESALASFVTENGVGKTIDNLNQLSDLPCADTEEYKAMREQVLKCSSKIRSGGYLIDALRKAEAIVR